MAIEPHVLSLTFVLKPEACQELEERFPSGSADLSQAGSVELWACKLVDYMAAANRILLTMPDPTKYVRHVRWTETRLEVEFTRDPT